MTIRLAFFSTSDRPYHKPSLADDEPMVYECDGKEGMITFDGSLDIADTLHHSSNYPASHPLLPLQCEMHVTERNTVVNTYNRYIIEIYKRILHEDTTRLNPIEDGDDIMYVSFSSSNRQTIYFRVITA